MKPPLLILLSLLIIAAIAALSCALSDDAVERGNEFFEARRYDEAIKEYTKAIEIDRENALAYINRGNAHANNPSCRIGCELWEGYARAIPDYSEAIRLEPDNALFYYKRGVAYYMVDAGYPYQVANRFSEAIEDYDKAISINPEFADAYVGRAQARLAQADYDNAVADTDKARKLIDPQLIHLYTDEMHRVYFQSGIAYYDTGLYDDAIRLFDKAIDVVASPSDYPDAYYRRGMSHYRKGNDRRAIADFDTLVGMEREYPDAAHYRELARKRLGK